MKYNFDTSVLLSKDLFLNDIRICPDNIPGSIPVEYNYNSYGYRTSEFDGSADLMILGCSFTHGDGMLEEFMWANLLSDKLDMKSVNLGQGGDGAVGQVRKAFYYFKHFGHPKVIVGLFPLYRMQIPSFKGQNRTEKYKDTDTDHINIIQNCNIFPGRMTKYEKQPYDPEKVLSPEVGMFYTHVMIDLLNQYCVANNITFIWSIWEDYDSIYHEYKDIDKDFYKNYCDLDTNKWTFNNKDFLDLQKGCDCGVDPDSCPEHKDLSKLITCHLEYKDHPLFHKAADRYRDIAFAHWGIHRNIHIAEEFYEKIANLK